MNTYKELSWVSFPSSTGFISFIFVERISLEEEDLVVYNDKLQLYH